MSSYLASHLRRLTRAKGGLLSVVEDVGSRVNLQRMSASFFGKEDLCESRHHILRMTNLSEG